MRARKTLYGVIAAAATIVGCAAYWLLGQGQQSNLQAQILNMLPELSESAVAETTLALETIDSVSVPFQNGIPVPSFEPQDRLTQSLAGTWKKLRFQADHEQSMAPRTISWETEVDQQSGGLIQPDFDDSEWATIELPLPENSLLGYERRLSTETYEDGVWYRRTFSLGEEWKHQAVTLHALSISYIGDIWINGHWAGYHEGGFTPFALDVTPYVITGDRNVIVIRVDNPPWGSRNDTIPAVEGTDFFNYTGVIQDLYLEGSEPLHIVRSNIVPVDTNGTIDVKVVIENRSNHTAMATLSSLFFEADRNADSYLSSPETWKIAGAPAAVTNNSPVAVEFQPLQTRVVSFRTVVEQPKLWSMDDPNLYVGQFTLSKKGSKAQDTFWTQFGIRKIETKGTQILLNGMPVFLKGIARHEEWQDSGRTANWDKIQKDLEQIRAMDANFVRTGHYPNHVYTYVLLDRLGLAYMDENPLWQLNTIHYKAQEKRLLIDQMWREMIFSQYNRPSGLLWSTQNESKDVKLRKAYNERVVNDLRTHYDDGRLVTQSAAADQPGARDESMEPLDVAGWTMYFGVFHGSTPYRGTRLFLERAHDAWPDKPILNTEFGRWSREDDFEVGQQSLVYRDTMNALMEKATVSEDGAENPNGYVAGIDFWIMYNWYVNHNKWIDTFGIYHMDRSKMKPVGSMIKEDFGRYHLAGQSAPVAEDRMKQLTDIRDAAVTGTGGVTAAQQTFLKRPVQSIAFAGNGNQAERAARIEIPELDVSYYAYLQLALFDTTSEEPLAVTLEDSRGTRWTYETYPIITNEWHIVVIPIHEAKESGIVHINALGIASKEEDRTLHLSQIFVSRSGTDIPDDAR